MRQAGRHCACLFVIQPYVYLSARMNAFPPRVSTMAMFPTQHTTHPFILLGYSHTTVLHYLNCIYHVNVQSVKWLRTGKPGFHSRQGYVLPSSRPCSVSAFHPNGYGFLPIKSSQTVKFTNLFYPAPRLIMRGALPPLPFTS